MKDKLSSLRKRVGAKSDTEVMRNALGLYELLLDEQDGGHVIALLKVGRPLKRITLKVAK